MPLKTGITAMVLALICTGAVAVFALLGGPREPVPTAKVATEGGAEPLVRSDPGVESWREEAVASRAPRPRSPKGRRPIRSRSG